jgi:predicted AAA+ superfamily ATPase
MYKQRSLFRHIEPYLHSPEAIIITGMRRTGKTTLLNHIYGSIESKNKIFLDLENPVNRKYFEEENYERIKKAFEFMGIDFNARPYIFLDEIQLVKNLSSIAKYLIDHYRVKFFLTGSASFYMKNLFTESLAGRKYIFELFPLTFKEFLGFKEIRFKIPADRAHISKTMHDNLDMFYDEFMRFGGFPGVVLKSSVEEKKKALEEIFNSFYQLEILQLGDFRKNEKIRDLILLLAERVGTKIDIQKLSRDLGISRPTIYEYLAFLESTFFLHMLRPYSKGKSTEIRKMPKLYLCDSGLAYHLGMKDLGRLFENSVFQDLKRKGSIHYYQKKSGAEIDFILAKTYAYEVKLTPQATDVKKLKKVALELKLEGAKIVAKKFNDLDDIIYGFML